MCMYRSNENWRGSRHECIEAIRTGVEVGMHAGMMWCSRGACPLASLMWITHTLPSGLI